jgi:hypothetical protein
MTFFAKSAWSDETWKVPTASLRETTVPPADSIAATADAAETPSSATRVYWVVVAAATADPAGTANTIATPVAIATEPAAKRLLSMRYLSLWGTVVH